jgi:hypothetical protein
MLQSNLVLTFKALGEEHLLVKQAARIKVDGCGLTLTNARTGKTETIPLENIDIISIQSVRGIPGPIKELVN